MTDEQLTIDDALKPDDPAEDATGEAEAEPETVEAEAEQTEESESSSVEDSEEAAPPAEPSEPAEQMVPVKAVKSEREKRQAAERERDELRRKVEELEKPPAEEPKPKTSVFDDEEKAFEERLSDAELKRLSDRYDMSQALAEDKWGEDKVAEAAKTFETLVKDDPSLGKRILDARLPYYEMMRIVESHEKRAEAEDPEALRERIRAEEREKLKAEMEAGPAAERKERESLTPSLASARSSGPGTKQDPPRIERAEEVYPE